jgi:hypothetical protein
MTAAVRLCQTCFVWGQGACRLHQGRRDCPGCGGSGRVAFMQLGAGGRIEVGEVCCSCVEERK